MDTPAAALTSTQLRVLQHLVVGATRPTIAGALHLSGRTLDRNLVAIKRSLGTSQRLCLGVRAVRHDCVDPRHPVAHAVPRRSSRCWHPPTTVREVAVVGLLAAGHGVATAASTVGASVSTTRKDLARIRTVNGAIDLCHAGALFEALRWTTPDVGDRVALTVFARSFPGS